ncbi:hypothetical protein [Sorangium sp. So ce124]|uniref:hypothetical protein n=1 Tax=Sorangium sp. So ce124 TaxID=3133280 RepID=UPI003F614871
MRALPPMSPASRRHIAQLLHRLMATAAFPCRLVATNPLPRGFLPMLGPAKAKACLYPDEDARLLASTAIPLCWRVLWGSLNREGPRISEAARLQVQDVDLDLDRGALRLEKNKTNDPRASASRCAPTTRAQRPSQSPWRTAAARPGWPTEPAIDRA